MRTAPEMAKVSLNLSFFWTNGSFSGQMGQGGCGGRRGSPAWAPCQDLAPATGGGGLWVILSCLSRKPIDSSQRWDLVELEADVAHASKCVWTLSLTPQGWWVLWDACSDYSDLNPGWVFLVLLARAQTPQLDRLALAKLPAT